MTEENPRGIGGDDGIVATVGVADAGRTVGEEAAFVGRLNEVHAASGGPWSQGGDV